MLATRPIAFSLLAVVVAASAACSSDCCPNTCAPRSPCASPCAPGYGGYATPAPGYGGYATPAPGYGQPMAPQPGQPGYGAPVAPQGMNVVTVQGHAYNPATLTVRAGTTVRWMNRDPEAHSATGNGFDVELPPGGEGSYTFATPGTYDVTCRYHPEMRSRVIVQ